MVDLTVVAKENSTAHHSVRYQDDSTSILVISIKNQRPNA